MRTTLVMFLMLFAFTAFSQKKVKPNPNNDPFVSDTIQQQPVDQGPVYVPVVDVQKDTLDYAMVIADFQNPLMTRYGKLVVTSSVYQDGKVVPFKEELFVVAGNVWTPVDKNLLIWVRPIKK